ncbi:hypothetical protein sos41_42260 [Alphaproteobacteria bacterium SO-S41]|nr:hypothetical protein sos41_42260 [Alphaproteobacteria bacterium SO-S41]
MTQQPNGVHHLAVMAGDIKKHIQFFSEVMGCPLVAIFDMHGVPGALHAFLKLNDHCYFTIVQMEGNDEIPQTIGQTHAGSGGGRSASGTMQHLAFKVDTEEDLLAMRDRIRSHGVPVFGPLDHGMCKSMYFAGPDNLALEVATSAETIDPRLWIDPTTLAKCNISPEEAARFKAPAAFTGASPVKQPAYDPSKPHMAYPKERYQAMLGMTDEEYNKRGYSNPPVSLAAE